jgi:hypothetical protein
MTQTVSTVWPRGPERTHSMEDQNNQVGGPGPEEVTPVARPEPPRRGFPPLAAVLILIIIGLVVWAVVGRKPAWDAAAYLPKEVALAMTVDLSANPDKDAGREFIVEVLKDAGMKDPLKQGFGSLSEALKIDVEREVVPQLNGKGGFALGTEMAGGTPGITAVIGAKSNDAAAKLLEVVKKKLKAEGAQFTTDKYQGSEYARISAGMAYVCVGAVGSGIVVTAGEDTFKKAVDAYGGKPSLAQNEYYAKYKSTDKSTFMTTFYSGPGFYKLIGPFLGMAVASMGPDAAEQLKKGYESVPAMVCNVQISGAGLRAQIKAESTEEVPARKQISIKDQVANIPKDAAVVVCSDELDKVWKYYMKKMEAMPGSMRGIEQMTAPVKEALGIDVFKDVVDHIKSLQVYYVPKPPANPAAFPGDLVIVLKVDKPDAIAATLNKVHAAVPNLAGAPVKQVLVGGQKLFVVPSGSPDLQIFDALAGDELLIALTGGDPAGAAKSALGALHGKGTGLDKSARFQAAVSPLWTESAGFVYGDAGKVVEALQKDITPAKDRKAALAVVKKVGPFAFVGREQDKQGETVFFAPFLR